VNALLEHERQVEERQKSQRKFARLLGVFTRHRTMPRSNEHDWPQQSRRLERYWNSSRKGWRMGEHVYFYAVNGASDETRRSYLDRAYLLGRNFTSSSNAAAA
jgi:hypothetical protein